jgi:4-aminobutyrate aminotransferase
MQRPSFLFPHAEHDIVFSHGQGCWLYTSTGEKILDFAAGYATACLGYGKNPASQAVAAKAIDLIHSCSCDFANPEYLDLAQYFQKRLQNYYPNMGIYIGLSGAEVIESAIKLVNLQEKSGTLIAMKGGFHGRTSGALSVGSSSSLGKNKYKLLDIPVEVVDFPETEQDLSVLKQQIESIAAQNTILGVLTEPILGEGGYKFPPRGFLALLRNFTKELNAYLIFDEIQTGIGRTGFLFAFEDEEIAPDILLVAKGLGAGMPIGAMVFSQDIFNTAKWDHASTFSGNILSCTAALQVLKVVDNPRFLSYIKTKGELFLSQLQELESKYPILAHSRGKGLMAAVDIVGSAELRNFVVTQSFKQGLLLLKTGKNAIRFSPPLIITPEEIKMGMTLFEKSIQLAMEYK